MLNEIIDEALEGDGEDWEATSEDWELDYGEVAAGK